MRQTASPVASDAKTSSGPWWKFPHVWMVFGGPAIVVVASFVTLYLAVTRPDPVMDIHSYQYVMDPNKPQSVSPASLAPAEQARNHAATGVPQPRSEP